MTTKTVKTAENQKDRGTTHEVMQQALEALIFIRKRLKGWESGDRAIASLKEVLAQPDGWRTMESAKKFSDEIDIWSRGQRFENCTFGKPTSGEELGWIYESHSDYGGPIYDIVKNPTHWMPLPPPPAGAAS